MPQQIEPVQPPVGFKAFQRIGFIKCLYLAVRGEYAAPVNAVCRTANLIPERRIRVKYRSIKHYTYDPEIPSVPGKTLTVYGLDLGSAETVRQAASMFQLAHPDVRVELIDLRGRRASAAGGKPGAVKTTGNRGAFGRVRGHGAGASGRGRVLAAHAEGGRRARPCGGAYGLPTSRLPGDMPPDGGCKRADRGGNRRGNPQNMSMNKKGLENTAYIV